MKKYFLGIETSTDKGEVVLLEDEKILWQDSSFDYKRHSEWLIETIYRNIPHKILNKINIAVSIGPGSFTGIRVGIAAAKGLAFPNKLALAPIVSLYNITYQIYPNYEGKKILALVHSAGDEFYACFYKIKNAKIIKESDYFIIKGQEIAQLNQSIITISNKKINNINKIISPSALYNIIIAKEENLWGSSDSIEPFYLKPPSITK